MFLPDLHSVQDAGTVRTLRRRRIRAAAGVLLAFLPGPCALLLPPGQDPNLVAVLVPPAILLGLGLLGGALLLAAPLLRPLLARIPEDAAFRLHLDDRAWRLEDTSAHQMLAFHDAAARPGPRLAPALIRRHARLPHMLGGALSPQASLVLFRAAGHQGAILSLGTSPAPPIGRETILCAGIPLLLERLPSAPAAPSPASPPLL